jgi:cell division protein FtsL
MSKSVSEKTSKMNNPQKDNQGTNVRLWLEKNKIFFETVAASFLTIMAIVVSIVQINISNKQTDLLRIQTEISQKEYQNLINKEQTKKTAYWSELKNAMFEILVSVGPNGVESFKKLSIKDKLDWKIKIRNLLDSQTKNPVLIENKECLGYWRNAISTLTVIPHNPLPFGEKRLIIEYKSILKDVSYVWGKLVLDSDEISATGGRPIEQNK